MNKKTTSIIFSIFLLFILSLTFLFFRKSSNEKEADRIVRSKHDKNNGMVSFLQQYIRINTSHPNPNYQKAIQFFEARAKKDGFQTSIIPLASGLNALLITLKGTDSNLPSLLLNHHMDVVPAKENEKWSFPPFSGQIAKDKIYGRGTQDMKGVGVAHYFALKKIKDEKMKLKRTVHLILVPDEEVGGFKGTGEFIKTGLFKNLNIGFVLDEGIPSGKNDTLLIKVSERKVLHIEFTSLGIMGHGSCLLCQNAANKLVLFLSRLAKHQEQQKEKAKKIAPGLLLSMNITSLQAGIIDKKGKVSINVIPNKATATVDIRVPPAMKKNEVIEMIKNQLKNFADITYNIKAQSKEMTFNKNFETAFYKTMEKTITKLGLNAKPFFAEFSTDGRFYMQQKIEVLGVTPFTTKPNLHGTDEYISVQDLQRGQTLFFNFLKTFCM